MIRYILCVCFFLAGHEGYCQSHGLQFLSHEVVQEKRTSLHLTPNTPICLQPNTEISFDLTFLPHHETYFGYIMRLITSTHQSIDLVYNQRLARLNFVIGENYIGGYDIDSARLFGNWSQVRITFDTQLREASFYMNDRLISKGRGNFTSGTCCNIYFGANDFEGFQTLDVPPMNIKDIRIRENGQLKHYFPLSESKGNEAIDEIGKKVAQVRNPLWIQPKHRRWEKAVDFDTKGAASIAFDSKREVLYVVSVDSIYELSFSNMWLKGEKLSRSRQRLPSGNQSVFDPVNNKLYNFYVDEKRVSTFDPASKEWDVNFTTDSLTVFWQVNKCYSPSDSSLYILGGYGQLQYKNLLQRYHFPTKTWEIVPYSGDRPMPRYLNALGMNATRDTIYIIGGYGSKSGDQGINPQYSYDLMAYSVKDRRFHTVLEYPKPAKQFCFANSMVTIPGSSDFYALIYPTDKFNTTLQLIKGNFSSSEYKLMGDAIPYSFYDIASFADLYYCPLSKKLVAVTLYNSKENITNVKVHTIFFPPDPADSRMTTSMEKKEYWWYLLAMAAVAGLGGWYYYRRGKSPIKNTARVAVPPPAITHPFADNGIPTPPTTIPPVTESREIAAVFLFGPFEVFDAQGQDITQHFTPLLKELFLLLLIYSLKDGKGISPEKMYTTLWPDKLQKDAKNNYSVNILKLKNLLEKVGNYQLIKEAGKWRLDILNESIYVDYQQYIRLVAARVPADRTRMLELLHIAGRGAFLKTSQYEWLDHIKADISNYITDAILSFMTATDMSHDAELMVRLSNCLFFFDTLNEEALVYKSKALILLGRHGMAKEVYQRFTKEYKESYGQDFERSFQEITGHAH
ncbi:Kelch motif-containing protein [Chitinophaga ginsengisegetis]|uniref:Kelch motif-containing protein n=1 Tax=Chitinophaga ginsengisegetis TaxID=393003 RepID=A0A1T5PBS4_9BACT|nr:galactose oxidase [Chitinophaga ginsengisegetis]SKD10063.1 Kelch motif-containing protein [Chitinophaga ginsengisegetis]